MHAVPIAELGADQSSSRVPGSEPLPGYKLLEPLGRGGFGEVWKCEVPGGLHKAIKFVVGDPDAIRGGEQLCQEMAAFEQIKRIRHPFLLTLERVEQIGLELIMVMELADRQLADRFTECRQTGLEGIPRRELLGYMLEAAEALDVLGTEYGLQHLDVKPANLFLIAGHLKVGDYGLVSPHEATRVSDRTSRGLSPRYAAPEILRGHVDNRSDQYSLGLVYFELLTGGFPFTGKTAAQMMLQHVSASPEMSALPECDRLAVGRSLKKKPEERYPNCREFVQELLSANPSSVSSALAHRLTQSDRIETKGIATPIAPAREDTTATLIGNTLPASAIMTPKPRSTLRTVSRRDAAEAPLPETKELPWASEMPAPPKTGPANASILKKISSVVAVGNLVGEPTQVTPPAPREFAAAVFKAAGGCDDPDATFDGILQQPDGTWGCEFPSTVPPAVAPFKLGVVVERWKLTLDQTNLKHLVLRKECKPGLWRSMVGKKAGLELSVQISTGDRPIRDVTAMASVTGKPDEQFTKQAEEVLPKMLSEIRAALGDNSIPRKTPRVKTNLPVMLYPIHDSGAVDARIEGWCRDVSTGGIAVATQKALPTSNVFIAFDTIPDLTGWAILIQILRNRDHGEEHLAAGPYRFDL